MDPILIHTEVLILPDPVGKFGLALKSADHRCRVDEYEKIYILKETSDPLPVHIQFKTGDTFKITAVGFAEYGEPGCHTKKGPCGACFYLDHDIEPNSDMTPPILNKGPFKIPADPYHFKLWVQWMDKPPQPAGIDPQIYNQGVGPPPWWRKLLIFLRRIWREIFGG